MRSQLHALAALLSTKERPVLTECEVPSRASQDVVEGNILMLSKIEQRFLGRQANSPPIPTTLDMRLEEFFETMKRKIVSGRNCVRSTYVVEMEWKRGELLIVSSAIWAQHFVTTVVGTLSHCCVPHTPHVLFWSVPTSSRSFSDVSVFPVSTVSSVSMLQRLTTSPCFCSPIYQSDVLPPSVLIILLMALISSAFFANTFVLVCNFMCFFADVKLGCTH